ncbi:Protein kinase domain-containing protein [Heracleum sosnowskyi]|uniref:Protein kinase domain-containing protein n=1 Tax=Heracleum sosnowskyi TaxID=360622 RepID=A0AAD8LXT2_9APIA|nr:Protein kinase domain-containing protein [Heracleum sosnowskyi]
MLRFSLHLFLLLPQVFLIFNICSAVLYTPPDNILLNCGASYDTTSSDGREWDTDTAYILKASDTSSAESQLIPSVDQSPYLLNARIFPSKFTYKIPVSKAGQKFLRLYFYPANYSNGFDMTKSFFSVHAADYTLLSNFSAFLNLHHSPSLVKEYVITVDQSCLLDLTFTPSPSSYAFVNAIEVISIPDKLYIKGDGDEDSIKKVGQDARFSIDDSYALENLYRLNVGGGDISSTHDSGMFRSWDNDEPYLLGADTGVIPLLEIPINYTSTTPPYTAPEHVYSTGRTMDHESYSTNMTWTFPVDSECIYLVRLYFCEYREEITTFNQLVYDIFINNMTAEQEVYIFYWTGGRGIPIYRDYVVLVGYNPYLWLTLQPNKESKPEYNSTILNGLEIFRLSSNGSLAAPNPEYVPPPPSVTNKSRGTQKNGASDSPLVGACIGEESLKKFGEVGYSCLGDQGIDRPTMRDVVSSLEVALQLQESQGKLDQDNLYLTKSVADARSGEASTSSTSSDGFKSGIGSVFSDILNPNAR